MFIATFPVQNVYHIWLNVKNKHKQRSKKSKMGRTSLLSSEDLNRLSLNSGFVKHLNGFVKEHNNATWVLPVLTGFMRIYLSALTQNTERNPSYSWKNEGRL